MVRYIIGRDEKNEMCWSSAASEHQSASGGVGTAAVAPPSTPYMSKTFDNKPKTEMALQSDGLVLLRGIRGRWEE